ITEGLSLSLSERQTLSMQGYDLIRNGGKLWDAYRVFLQAADLEGMLYVARAMLSSDVGFTSFSSSRPLIAASMLMPRP
ncbi:MAG: hypothetical protein AAF202_08140, partial [Pseudomonadota bacterium]